MTAHLSQEWLDLQRELVNRLPDDPGCTAKVQHVVTGGPDGDVRYVVAYEDGHIVDTHLGEVADADIVLTVPHDVAVDILTGALDVNAAYMQGRIKLPDTRSGPLLRLLARLTGAPFGKARADLAAATDL